MSIFDPDEVITEYSLKEAIEDGVLVEIFKKQWGKMSGGKPIVASANVYENIRQEALREIWGKYVLWQKYVMPKRPENERLFSVEIDAFTVWVLDDRVCYTILYPTDY